MDRESNRAGFVKRHHHALRAPVPGEGQRSGRNSPAKSSSYRFPARAGKVAAILSSIIVVLIGSPPVYGQAHDIALAEALFNEGQSLLKAGNIAAACEKFEESYKLDPALGTLLNLAQCHEKEGKLVIARGEYDKVRHGARLENNTRRENLAKDRISEIEKRLSRLVVVVESPVEGMQVRLDGTVLSKAAWGLAFFVDPGDHHLEATAPGKKPFNETVSIDEGGTERRIDISLEDDAPPPEPVVSVSVPVNASSDRAGEIVGKKPSTVRPWAYVAGGLGIACLGTGIGLTALSFQDAAAARNANQLDQTFIDSKRSSATNLAVGAVILYGAAAVGAGLSIWLFIAPPTSSESKPAQPEHDTILSMAPIPGGAALSLSGRF